MRYKLFICFILFLICLSVFAQVPEEKMGEFNAVGAVTFFDELCLKIYTDYEKSIDWMDSYSHGENKTKSADPYRVNPNDRVFLVGSSLSQFVVSFGEKNLCSIYGVGVDRGAANNTLKKLMAGYAQAWNTKFVQTDKNIDGNMTEITHVANIPGTDDPILGLIVSYWEVEGEQNSLIKISGISLKRMQTFNEQRNSGTDAPPPIC
ncbi:MAG: hypothetical protein WDZ30_02860 [Cellvibrionaceae bacterium]